MVTADISLPVHHRPPADGDGGGRLVNYNIPAYLRPDMTQSLERECPGCGESREFYKAASMEIQLGTKEKWHCPECDYGFVTIDDIDTSASAPA